MDLEKINKFKEDIDLIMSGDKALSYSALSAFLKSPKHFYSYKTEKVQTPAMLEGIRFHMACLEPKKFEQKYWVLDDTEKCIEIGGKKPRSTNAYKEWLAIQDSLNEGRERISKDEYDTYMNMSAYLRRNKASKDLMNNLSETEFSFEYDYQGFKIRGKGDGKGTIDKNKYQIDLKKVADASFKKVRWLIQDMNYDLQAGIYYLPERIKDYYIIFIDTKCNVTVVKLLDGTIETGVIKLENGLEKFTQCAEEDAWQESYNFHNGGYINI